jgi:hypothetical protein
VRREYAFARLVLALAFVGSGIATTIAGADEKQVRRFNEQAPKAWSALSKKYDSTVYDVKRDDLKGKISASVNQSGEFASYSGIADDSVGNFVVIANPEYAGTIVSKTETGGPYYISQVEQNNNFSVGDEKQKLLRVTRPSLCFFRWHLPDSLVDLEGIGVKGQSGFRVLDVTNSTDSNGMELVCLELIPVIRDSEGRYVQHVSSETGSFSARKCNIRLMPSRDWSIESAEIIGVVRLPSGVQQMTMKSFFFYHGASHHPSSKQEILEIDGKVRNNEKFTFSDPKQTRFDSKSCYLSGYGLPEPTFTEKRTSIFSYWKVGLVTATVLFIGIRFLRK